MLRRLLFIAPLLLPCAGIPSAQAKLKKEIREHYEIGAAALPPGIFPELKPEKAPLAVGFVSWYGPGFHGRRTASGERYNMNAMTCASRDLPFGTMLELTNLANGEKVVVRVNDRGPFKRWRILDLSYAAAKKLGFHRSGQTKVEVREAGTSALALAD